jgi:hypothetical protein
MIRIIIDSWSTCYLIVYGINEMQIKGKEMKIKKEEIISIKTISLHFYSLHKTLIIK